MYEKGSERFMLTLAFMLVLRLNKSLVFELFLIQHHCWVVYLQIWSADLKKTDKP